MILQEDRILDIYSDASITEYNGITYGCPGAIAVHKYGSNQAIIDGAVSLLYNSTNNQSEIYAVLLAACIAVRHRNEFDGFRIISDSRISVEGLRSWIYSWVKNAKDGVLVSSSGQPVANQQIFLYTFYTILNSLNACSLCHIDGHRGYSESQIYKTVKNFCKVNGIQIDNEIAKNHITYNNEIDNITRSKLSPDILPTLPLQDVNNVQLVSYIPTQQELDIYRRITVTF